MTDLPFEALRTVALRKLAESGSRPLFVALSGAHLYGFASSDSDFDVRGCHLLPLADVVSLARRHETIECSIVEEGRQVDLVTHDAAKYFSLMLKRNGYIMEQVFSPLIVVGGPELDELRDIARGCLTRQIYHHYKGFSVNQLAMLEREPTKKVKTMLYIYRVLLTGIHVLCSGEVEANLGRLLELYPQEGVKDLMAAKVRELTALPEDETGAHLKAIESLRERLEQAFLSSKLDETPRRAGDLNSFLVRLRLGNEGG